MSPPPKSSASATSATRKVVFDDGLNRALMPVPSKCPIRPGGVATDDAEQISGELASVLSYARLMLAGQATAVATGAFRDASGAAPGHFRQGLQGLWLSSLGIGTYLGRDDAATD